MEWSVNFQYTDNKLDVLCANFLYRYTMYIYNSSSPVDETNISVQTHIDFGRASQLQT